MAFFVFLGRRAEQKMRPHFFSGANIQQCTMHKYIRMYSQNQISRKWLVWGSNRWEPSSCILGKWKNFLWYKKKNISMFVYAMRKQIYGQFSKVSNDNLCYFAFYLMLDLKKAEKSILKIFWEYCYPVLYPAIFWWYLLCSWVVWEGEAL